MMNTANLQSGRRYRRPSRSAPVPGRSNAEPGIGLGKFECVRAVGACCARGRAHSGAAPLNPQPSTLDHASAFTLVEILIAIGILSLVCASIFSTWMAILRANKVGLEAAATVQRARIVSHVLEDSLTSAQLFSANQRYYSFLAENGRDASLSFVARLSKSFPRSGKFGDLDVRRLTFSVEPGADSSRELVLRQNPLVMDLDEDEKTHPVVLARNVRKFSAQFWDPKQADWLDEWTATNMLPPMVKVTLELDQNERSAQAFQIITRIVSLPAGAVTANWQMPRGGPGGPGGPGGGPPQLGLPPVPGQQPPVNPKIGGMAPQ